MSAQIIPSLLAPDRSAFSDRLRVVSRRAAIAQIDVLDGSLVPYKDFFDPAAIDSMRPRIEFEAHFMTRDPAKKLAFWNYPWVKKIIFHIEAEKHPESVIAAIKRMGKLPGLAVSPNTPLERVLPYLDKLDTVLVMTVYPGRNGAKFLPRTVEKIRRLRKIAPGLNIEADGGINPKTAKLCAAAGANLLVAGSFLKNEDFKEKFQELKKAIN